jgi:hypothetical protein
VGISAVLGRNVLDVLVDAAEQIFVARKLSLLPIVHPRLDTRSASGSTCPVAKPASAEPRQQPPSFYVANILRV